MNEQTGEVVGQENGAIQGAKPPPLPVPAQVTVFGIIHLVLAVFGVITVVFSNVMQGFSKSLVEAQAGSSGIAEAQVRVQTQIIEATKAANHLTSAGVILLAVLLAVAGILLLKRRPAGVMVSNVYACLSMLLKVLSVVVFFGWTMRKLEPAMTEMAHSGGREAEFTASIMRISMMAGAVVSPVMMCIYPILALVLLNRVKVKKALAAAGR